jgi:hypothetical protein
MRLRFGLVAFLILGLAGCGPKAPAKPATPPPPPAPQLGQACKSAGAGEQGNCAAGLTCQTVGGASFCASACPCAGGVPCATSPSAPEMCLKPCASDADCGSGLACDAEWRACAPAGMLVARPPQCTAAAPQRKAFGKVTQLSQVAGAHDPAVILDRNGNLVMVYAAGGADSKLYAAAVDVAGEVTVREADKAIDVGRENASDPWLASDRNGRLYLATLGWNGGAKRTQMMVGVSTSDDGVTWSAPVTAHDAASDCAGDAAGCLDKPLLVVGRDRNATTKGDVVYLLYWSHVTSSLRATHSIDAGQTYSTSAQVGNGAFADGEVTSSGKLHIVFAAGPGNRMGDLGNGVYYTSSVDSGESFSAPVRISPESEPVPYWFNSARVIVDVPRKMLYAVYVQGSPDGKWDVMLATSRDGGVTFSSQKVNDDTACATHMLPAAALDPSTGRVHIAWLENRTGTGAVGYVSCTAEGRACTKNETVSDQPFAWFGYGRDSAQSLGDYISLVHDAKHKMVHVVWAQPVDEGGKVASRLYHAAARTGR